ncbi:MAG TPA: 50S ribosomal protein L1 [Candidatus Dormibacteraeota bacterium]|nr:50S ribosomal protein L1 [Candidatus Dormibacteraeota bacterium]
MAKKRGKRYQEALKKIEAALGPGQRGSLTPMRACEVVRDTSTVRFDATVEAHVRLGVDPRHADQIVRGTVSLPNGTGRTVRVLCFVGGDKVREAQEAGADFVGGDDLIQRIQQGWTDFDVAIATPDMMSKVGPLGRILGPRGLMPNPRAGTVTFDVGRAVREVKGGRVEFRTDRYGIVHVAIGKVSFEPQQLQENLAALVEALVRNKPAAAKGQYLRSLYLTTTMGPSIPVDVREAAKLTTG